METQFTGGSRNKVDGKGRVSIPVKYRRVLQNCDNKYSPGGAPRLYITYGDPKKQYLECWSGDGYEALMRQISAMKSNSPEQRLLSYFYKTNCESLTVDDTGRLVIPPELRDKIALGDEAVFEGDGNKFLIMNSDIAAERKAGIMALYKSIGGDDPFFDPLSLVEEDPTDAMA